MKRAALLLSILIGICNGCTAHVPPPPVVLPVAPCPAPAAPVLPRVDGESPLDTPSNVAVLLERESCIRRYIAGLRAALTCYQAQTGADDGVE